MPMSSCFLSRRREVPQTAVSPDFLVGAYTVTLCVFGTLMACWIGPREAFLSAAGFGGMMYLLG